MSETPQIRLKRLRMRSMRRGIKEMDVLLMRFSEVHLETLSSDDLDLYEVFLEENDQDLYLWVSGQADGPEQYKNIISLILRANSVAF